MRNAAAVGAGLEQEAPGIVGHTAENNSSLGIQYESLRSDLGVQGQCDGVVRVQQDQVRQVVGRDLRQERSRQPVPVVAILTRG